jgi:hypothetical protein
MISFVPHKRRMTEGMPPRAKVIRTMTPPKAGDTCSVKLLCHYPKEDSK